MIKGINPRLAEAGKIKIGGRGPKRLTNAGRKKPENQRTERDYWRPPEKRDHFVITKTVRDSKDDLVIDQVLMEALDKDKDGKIRAIPIVLHDDDIDKVFATSYALYSGKKCSCRGDGERAKRSLTKGEDAGKTVDVPCPCKFYGAEKGAKCKPNGKFCCSIAAPGAAIAGALHIWRTTSIISIERMIASLLQIRDLCGTLIGIPLWLKVEPVKVEPSGITTTVYCCHVELRASDIAAVQRQALEAAELRRRLGGPRPMLLPPADDAEPEDEQAEVAEEFYPEDETNIPMAQDADVEVVEPPADLKAMVGGKKPKVPTPKKIKEPEPEAEEPPPPPDGDEVDYGGVEDDGELY
jgi:hypothetical protein